MATQDQQQPTDDASTPVGVHRRHCNCDYAERGREQESVLLEDQEAGDNYHNMRIPKSLCAFATPKSTKRQHQQHLPESPPPAPRKRRLCRQSTSLSSILGAHTTFFIPSDLHTLPDCIRTLFTHI